MHLLLLCHQSIYLIKMKAQLCGVLQLYYRFLPPEAAYVVSNRSIYNRLQQGMEEKNKGKMTGDCHCASWQSLLAEIHFWFVFNMTLFLALGVSSLNSHAGGAARHCEGQWGTQANFSHGVRVTTNSTCPSEVHVNTSPILEVQYTCPPRSFLPSYLFSFSSSS